MTWTLLAFAGGLGALARFEVGSIVAERSNRRFPLGTLTVNTVGAFLTGMAANLGGVAEATLVTGFLGGFTTFSTWMVETAGLAEEDSGWRAGVTNLVAMLTFGLAGAGVGLALS